MISKLTTLEALRAIAAILVVMYHLQDIFLARAGVVPFRGMFGAGDRGVDLFFVLSGFIIMTSHAEDVGHPDCIFRFCYKRACRLFPGVWIMTLLAVTMYAYSFGGADKTAKLEPWNIVASVFLLPQNGPALVNVTWTLKYEIFFYTLFGVLVANRKAGVVLLVIWQSAAMLVAVGLITQNHSLWEYYFRPISLEFGIGMACARLAAREGRIFEPMPCRVSSSILVVGATVFLSGLIYEVLVNPHGLEPIRYLVYGLSSGAVLLSASALERQGYLRAPSPLVWLGGASYAIYLVHYSVITLSAEILMKLGWIPINGIALAAVALCGVAGGSAFHSLVDHPAQTRLRRMGQIWFSPDHLIHSCRSRSILGTVARAERRVTAASYTLTPSESGNFPCDQPGSDSIEANHPTRLPRQRIAARRG
jgi:exopolysaccharide production protein ExoZ